MGYGYYTLYDGRDAGYGVDATCDDPGCDASITRGLDNLCGDNPAVWGPPSHGCGRYFCSDHLFFCGGPGAYRCGTCLDFEEAA